MFTFRKAGVADFPALANLRWIMCQEDTATSDISATEFIAHCTDFFNKANEAGRWHHWVAEADKIIIANISVQMIAMVPRPEDMNGLWCCVTNNYVRVEYRGQGIGTQLLTHAVEWSRNANAEVAIVWPSDTARSYYSKAGFSDQNDIHELKFR